MAGSKVADLTVDDLRDLIREVVIQTLSEMFADPDQGSELRDDFAAEVQRSLAATEAGGKTLPVEEVSARLGLTW